MVSASKNVETAPKSASKWRYYSFYNDRTSIRRSGPGARMANTQASRQQTPNVSVSLAATRRIAIMQIEHDPTVFAP